MLIRVASFTSFWSGTLDSVGLDSYMATIIPRITLYYHCCGKGRLQLRELKQAFKAANIHVVTTATSYQPKSPYNDHYNLSKADIKSDPRIIIENKCLIYKISDIKADPNLIDRIVDMHKPHKSMKSLETK